MSRAWTESKTPIDESESPYNNNPVDREFPVDDRQLEIYVEHFEGLSQDMRRPWNERQHLENNRRVCIELLSARKELAKLSALVAKLRERTDNSADKSVFDAVQEENRNLKIALESMMDYAFEGSHLITGIHNREEWYAARDFAKGLIE